MKIWVENLLKLEVMNAVNPIAISITWLGVVTLMSYLVSVWKRLVPATITPYQGNQVELLDLDYVTVPLLPAEALFVLYGMMEGWQRRRRFKRELIFQYLKENSGQPDILKSAKESYLLPGWLNSLIEELLN